MRKCLLILAGVLTSVPPAWADEAATRVPQFGLFEVVVENDNDYENPFADVDLDAVFTAPSGKQVAFFGFYDGDGQGGQTGNIWRQRFMPDEVGTWSFEVSFSDSSPGRSGRFECVAERANPGPWRQDPDNPHWFHTAQGERFLPVAVHADCCYTLGDWQNALRWCKARGYNTLVTSTFNTWVWGDGWHNVTAFATGDAAGKTVDYDRFNLRMWQEWDAMFQTAAEQGIYIGPFNGPNTVYGGQERGKYPPIELVYWPASRDDWDAPANRRLIRYLIARQGAFWNLAYWNLGNTELYWFLDEPEAIRYGEYFASITPFGRMITSQDCEQWHNEDRRWLSMMGFPASRKLNTIQTAVENPHQPHWGKSNINDTAFQEPRPNNELALDSYAGFPVMTTEGLWEGQPRAQQPLRIIWGFFAAGAHTVWADWKYESEGSHTYSSLGRGWSPVKPLDQRLFQLHQLGADCVGDEQLKLATDHLQEYEYWKMSPHNEVVADGAEAYCLAEPGRQYLVYAPRGGTVQLDLSQTSGDFTAWLFDPRTGEKSAAGQFQGGGRVSMPALDTFDWVLQVKINSMGDSHTDKP